MTLAATVGKYPVVVSVGTTQCEITFDEPNRLYTAYHLGKTSTGGAASGAVFSLMDGTTGAVATTYSSSTGTGKGIIESGIAFPIPAGLKKCGFKVASGTVALQLAASAKGNYYPDST